MSSPESITVHCPNGHELNASAESTMAACMFCGDLVFRIRRDKLGNLLPLPITSAQRAAIARFRVQDEWDAMDAADYAEQAEARIRELGVRS